ncbi:helix-turn-helix domain-containing protein [Streptomyces sp. NPDC005963]|uniref:TetR/AcrR family transcriptional regulator n=1 Tax=Streptomyces sp. NPDC005963 TaxID=3156721 RepID=UPI0034011CB5
MGATTGRRVGRPRAVPRAESGLTVREELLWAAARLFTTRGYAATTTRAVAEGAGMRQATIYHYFPAKEDLLAELLESTVAPSWELARKLLEEVERPAEERLRELCRADVQLLCQGPYDLGALYLLPEVQGERLAEFRRVRAELKGAYGRLLSATRAGRSLDGAERALRTDMVFGLVEGVILIHRTDPDRPLDAFADAVARAALRIVGVADEDGAAEPGR